MIEQAVFTYSTLGKTFKKQIETTEAQGRKMIKWNEYYGKQLVECNVLKEDSLSLEKK